MNIRTDKELISFVSTKNSSFNAHFVAKGESIAIQYNAKGFYSFLNVTNTTCIALAEQLK